jgi:hypothetical protein
MIFLCPAVPLKKLKSTGRLPKLSFSHSPPVAHQSHIGYVCMLLNSIENKSVFVASSAGNENNKLV